MGLSSIENTYLLLSFFFSLVLACILILIKVNYKESSISSIFFAIFFLTFYFYQPLLLIIDRLKSYTLYYSLEKPHFEIEDFLKNEYIIVGYIGTFFSNFILPIHTDITISGYDTFCKRFKDALVRYLKGKKIYLIIGVIYIILSFILYKVKDNDEEIEKKSIEFIPFFLNCLIVKDFFKAIWLLGAYFPLFISDLRLELNWQECCLCSYNTCYSFDYANQLENNIKKSLEKDKEKLKEAYDNIIYIMEKCLKSIFIRKEIQDALNKIENEQNKYDIKLSDKNEIEKISNKINENNSLDKLVSAVRHLFKTISKIPRKIYELNDIDNKRNKGLCNYCYHLFALIIIIGVLIFGFEISLSYYDYESLSSPLNLTSNFYWAFLISFLYFVIIYYSFLKKNSLTTQNIYGIFQTDTLCLLKFSEAISGLITPVSFLVVGTKAFGIFALRDNMTFMETFDIPFVENIFIGLKFDEVYDTYISLRMLIFLSSFLLTLTINTISIPLCCKKGKYILNWKINDKNITNIFDENGCCKKCYGKEDYEILLY